MNEQPKILEIHFKDKLYGGYIPQWIVSWGSNFWFCPTSGLKCFYCNHKKVTGGYFMFVAEADGENKGLLTCIEHYQDATKNFRESDISKLPLKILSFED